MSQTDICDLFAAPDLVSHAGNTSLCQVIKFPSLESDASTDAPLPLIKDAPEGARLMSVLASERRKTTFI